MKSNLVLQFGGHEADEASFVKRAQEEWKNAGNKVSDIKEQDNFFCPFYVLPFTLYLRVRR